MLDDGTYKHTLKIRKNFFGRQITSSLMMYLCWVMVVVSHNTLSFMTEQKTNVTTSISGKLFKWKGSPIFARKLDSCISKTSWIFFIVSISDTPSIKHWQNLGKKLDTAKENIPKQWRIGDTCFTSLATIGGNLYTRHPKNPNHVHKDSNDLLSVIIILGTDVHGD